MHPYLVVERGWVVFASAKSFHAVCCPSAAEENRRREEGHK